MKLTVTRGAKAEYQDETGRGYFSVSQHIQILDPDAFSGVSPAVLAAAGMRGEKLHVYFALMVLAVNGVVPWPDRPLFGPLMKRFDSMARWVEKYRPKTLPAFPPETSVASVKLKTAGTPDLPCLLEDDLAIIDLKNGIPRAVHSVQLHAYKKLCDISGLKRVMSLYSQADGSIAMPVDHTRDTVDWSAFMAANAILNWRMLRNV